MTPDAWLLRHSYLRSLAEFHGQVDKAASGIHIPRAAIPDWHDYSADFQSGIPLLHSSASVIDLRPAEGVLESLLGKIVTSSLPDQLVERIGTLSAQLHSSPGATRRAVAWLISKDAEFVPAHPGTLRYFGWTALGRFLRPILGAFAGWRDEDGWLRRYCPLCGALPAMAQLVGADPGRLRHLSCGCCGTRWRFQRTGCPFCEHDGDHRLSVVAVEGEAGLRIDYCEACSGYLKTYVGQGNEALLLADWTSLHLDILARDRGLKRLAGSLYEL